MGVETTLLSDSFEGSWPWANWDANMPDWIRSAGDGNSHSGTYSALSNDEDEGDLMCDFLDTSDASIIKLDFWFYYTGVDYDEFRLRALEDGSVWREVKTDLAGIFPRSTWNHYVCGFIDSNYINPKFQISLYSELIGPDEYLWVDDVNISIIEDDTYDVNLLDDGFESTPFDANWNDVTSNWTQGLFAQSGTYSAAATVAHQGHFVCNALDTSDAAAVKVDFWVHQSGTDETGFSMYYRSTDGWEIAAQLSQGIPDGDWYHFEEVLIESKYFHPDFQLKFICTLASEEYIYIDDVLITKRIIKTPYASAPNPSDGATGISVLQQLSWKAGEFARTHDVYFGTDESVVDSANKASDVFMGAQPGTTFDPNDPTSSELLADVTYYWRIDEANEDKGEPNYWKGEVWSFETKPPKAENPIPWDGSRHVSLSKTLSWTAGDGSIEHTVYFGTDETLVADSCDLVYKTTINAPDPCVLTPTLAGGTLYYWKINSNTGTIFTEGDVWSFKTARALELLDPNLVGWWPLTEKFKDSIVWDASGNEHHGTLVGDNVDIVTDGQRGHALDVNNPQPVLNSVVDCGGNVEDGGWANLTKEITLMAWFTRESAWHSNQYMITKGNTYMLRRGSDTSIEAYMEDLSDNDIDGVSDVTDGRWHHVALTYEANETADDIRRIYIDGVMEAEQTETGTLLEHGDTLVIGGRLNPSYNARGWDGRIGGVRLFNRALSASEIREYYEIRVDPNRAWDPYPRSPSVDVADRPLTLSWKKGDNAMGSGLHRVYFGTDQELVDACDASVDYGPQDVNYLDVGELPYDTTYYWRVDETDGTTVWKGLDWIFTMANFKQFDDFESYGFGLNNLIGQTWKVADWTGGVINLGQSSENEPVNNGEQSMKYEYDNQAGGWHYWSETYRDFGSSPQDWTYATGDVKSLRLYFYGETGNNPDDMWVVLKDSSSNESMKLYDGDLDDLKAGEWKYWDIDLSWFTNGANNVNLASVQTVYLGFGERGNEIYPSTKLAGTVYFDDFRVYPPHCVPSKAPKAALLSGDDCLIDEKDVDAMTDDWLDRDYTTAEPSNPGDANLIGWWNFDACDASDSSGNGHHGTIRGTVTIVEDANIIGPGNKVAYFPGGEGNDISCGGGGAETWADDMEQISIAAWVKIDKYTTEYQYIAAKEGSWRIMRYDTTTRPRFYTNGGNQSLLGYTDIQGGDWHHFCGVSDGTTKYIYIDGLLENSVTWEEGIDNSDPNIIIGGTERTDSLHRMWKGFIDDVRLYDDALTQEEVMFLAGHTGPAYNPIFSPANLTDEGDPCNSRFVNYKDFGIIADGWLTNTLWPSGW